MRNAQPYLVGNKVYGGGRPFPTMGPVDKMGYKERDARHKARRNALLRRMKAKQSGKSASADALRRV
jgi:hypothetical protein